jgi:hypothetical protein
MNARRFCLKGGFEDNTLYIEVSDDGSRVMRKDGIAEESWMALDDCLSNVQMGAWVEVQLDENGKPIL